MQLASISKSLLKPQRARHTSTMPPRVCLASAFAQPMKLFTSHFSTSASRQAVRRDVPKTATSQLLDLGSAPNPNLSRDSTKGISDLYSAIRPRDGARASPARTGRRGGRTASRQELEEDLKMNHQRDDYARQVTRKWAVGDVYSPHDLSPSEMAKFRQASSRKQDLVDVLGLKPLDMYRNFNFVAEAITNHGRIRSGLMTGLRPVNQRKMAKAVRRAIGLGLHPSVHRHPELILRDVQRSRRQNEGSKANLFGGF